LEPEILEINPVLVDANLHLARQLGEIDAKLAVLADRVLQVDDARQGMVLGSLQKSSQLTLIVWGFAVVLAALLVGLMLLESRRYERQLRETEELAEAARSANLAKARFLTMMSHELRTPMNGVLGLIALVRQTVLTEAQARLLEQSERSGRRMSDLLGDILDFTELDSADAPPDLSTFEPRELGAAVEGAVQGLVQRTAVDFDVSVLPDTPEWITADFNRIQRALTHCCQHAIERPGADKVSLILFYSDRRLTCHVQDQTPETDVLGRQETIQGFDTDSLGPTIARGLIERLGGDLDVLQTGVRDMMLRVPALISTPKRDCVRIDAHSDTTRLLVEAALDQRRWRIWSEELDRGRVAAVLMETNGLDEEIAAKKMRAAHPGARLVAVGMPSLPSLFDAQCPIPPDQQKLNAALVSGTDEQAVV